MYKIILAKRVRSQLQNHTAFLSRVSLPAAKKMRNSFADILVRLKENPFQFPIDPVFAELNLPYRKALFEGKYKVLFFVSNDKVFIDSVVDCRQQVDKAF